MNAIKAKFGQKKYHQNLLGESLEDLLRKATAKNLDLPDEAVNGQVVQAINEDATHSPKEIVILLKKRLEMDNPQKQFLAVELVGKVLRECQMIAPLQEEVLHGVAGVMTRPGRNSTAAQRAKTSARELLRSYGRTGYDAIRQVARANYAGARPGMGVVPGQPYPVVMAPGAPGSTAAVPGGVEKASLVDEVVRMVEAARGHTELLQDMLVNSSAPGAQDFERELMTELLSEVRELRTLFTPYLEQLGNLEGPDVEKAMCDALEAVDMLDNAIQLQRDVAVELSQQPPLPQQATAGPSTSAAAATTAPAVSTPSSSVASPPAVAQKDLIDLSDLSESLPSTTAPARAASDPFKDMFPIQPTISPETSSPAKASTVAMLPSSHPAQLPTSQPAVGSSSPLGAPPIRQQQAAMFAPFPGPMPTSNPQGFPPQQPAFSAQPAMGFMHGGVVASPPTSPTFTPPMSPTNFPYSGAAPMMPPHPPQMYPMMHMQVPQQQMAMYPRQGMPMNPMYGGQTPQMGFQDNAFSQQGFQDNAFQQQQMPQQQSYNTNNPNNPFASMGGQGSSRQSAPQSAVDKEWDMLFTDSKSSPQTVGTKF